MRLLVAGVALMAGFGTTTAMAEPQGPAPRPVPSNVWMKPGDIPMNSEYHWSSAAPTTTAKASFLSIRLCGGPAEALYPPASAISTQAASGVPASVVQAAGQWPGDGATASAPAIEFQDGLRRQLSACPGIGQVISVDLRPSPSWNGFAATVLIGENRDTPISEVHIYNVSPPESGTVSELAVTVPRSASAPSPWKPVEDAAVMRALAQPLCAGRC